MCVLTRAAARARAPTAGVRWPGRKRSRWHPVRCAQYAHVISTQMPTRKTRGFADSRDPGRGALCVGRAAIDISAARLSKRLQKMEERKRSP